jgi:hypothetical protein
MSGETSHAITVSTWGRGRLGLVGEMSHIHPACRRRNGSSPYAANGMDSGIRGIAELHEGESSPYYPVVLTPYAAVLNRAGPVRGDRRCS